MRQIQVEDGLFLRFPERDEEFNDGVEIGIIAALMGAGESAFTRWISTANVDQAHALAEKMGYHLVHGHGEGPSLPITFRAGPMRPKLRLVHFAKRSWTERPCLDAERHSRLISAHAATPGRSGASGPGGESTAR